MKIVTFSGVKFILTSDTNEALGELHRQMPAIMADVTGMRDSQSGEQKYFNRQDSWDIKQLHGNTTVTFYSKLVSKGKKVTREFSTIRESSTSSLGLVYELGTRDDTEQITTEGFYISPVLDWYIPSIIISLAEEDYGNTEDVEIPYSGNVTPLIKLPTHSEFDTTYIAAPEPTGTYPIVVGGIGSDPDIYGYTGGWTYGGNYSGSISINGYTLYAYGGTNYQRFDWEYVCYSFLADYFGYDGTVRTIINSTGIYPSGGAGAATEAIEELNWERSRAWCHIAEEAVGERQAIDSTFSWSNGYWEGDCGSAVRSATGWPYFPDPVTTRILVAKVPSELSSGEILTFTIWDELVDASMEDRDITCLRIYEYQGFPVYVFVLAGSNAELICNTCIIKYFAIYKDILYSSESFATNESKHSPRLHNVYDAEKSAIAYARACVVTYKNSEITNFSFEEDDNKGNLVQDRAMIFRLED